MWPTYYYRQVFGRYDNKNDFVFTVPDFISISLQFFDIIHLQLCTEPTAMLTVCDAPMQYAEVQYAYMPWYLVGTYLSACVELSMLKLVFYRNKAV